MNPASMFLIAQAEGEPSGGSSYMVFIYIAVFAAIFYFLLIRPGQKQKKQHQQLVDSVSKGAEVMTAGGIYGTITEVKDDYVMLEVAKKTAIKLSKGSIARVVAEQERPVAEDEPEADPESES